jgi:hypothetical protein
MRSNREKQIPSNEPLHRCRIPATGTGKRKTLSKLITVGIGATLSMSGSFTEAAGFAIRNDIETGTSQGSQYQGPGAFDGFEGAVYDGGNDAFDNYGRWQDPGGAGSSLSFTRNVEALTASNTYRFLDIFTNNTGLTISTTLTFFGNLGSDGDEMVDLSGSGLTVAHERRSDGSTYDPVIAHVYGNNAFAAANMGASISQGLYTSTVSLTLNPGQRAGILQFAYLTREDTTILNYGTNGTNTVATFITDATAVGNTLLNDPDVSGLSPGEVASIVNFNVVPEPSSALLLSLALTSICARRRRNQESRRGRSSLCCPENLAGFTSRRR